MSMREREQALRRRRHDLGLRMALGGGAFLTWAGTSTPWFGFNELADDRYRIVGGDSLPASGLLIALQVVLSLAPLLPGKLCHPGVLATVAGVAVCATLGTTMIVAFAFADLLARGVRLTDIAFGDGLPLLVVGMTTMIVASGGWFAASLGERPNPRP